MASKIPYEVLNNNSKIPYLGFSSWGWGETGKGNIAQAVKDAIDLGIRYIDTAPINGNEEEVGDAIFAKIKEGVVKREELYIVGKLWDPKAFHDPALLKDAILRTLRNLNLTYLDLYVIQCPEGELQFVDTWHEMEKLVDNFVVKSVGLSHFNEEQIKHLLTSARCVPVINQFDCHPYQTQRKLSEFCKSKNIAVTVYNPFGSSALLEDPTIESISRQYRKTPEQILLRYQIQRGHIVIPISTSKLKLKENMDIFKFEINDADMVALGKLDRNKQYSSLRTDEIETMLPAMICNEIYHLFISVMQRMLMRSSSMRYTVPAYHLLCHQTRAVFENCILLVYDVKFDLDVENPNFLLQ